MKKVFSILLIISAFILVGCSENSTEKETYSLMVPNGSTSIAQLYMEANKDLLPFNYNVDRISGPEALIAAFTSESHDFIVAPSVLGAKLYNAEVNYKLVGTVSYGNLYLASSLNIESLADLEGFNIIAFGQMTTPDIILKALLNSHNIADTVSLSYVSSSQATLLELLRDSNQVVLISEPFLSMAQEELEHLSLLNLSQLWEDDLALPNFPQAALYAHNDVSDEAVITFTEAFNASIKYANDNPNQTGEYSLNLSYPFNASIISQSIPNSQLLFKTAKDSKIDFENFYQVILNSNPALIGNQLPDEDYYRSWDSE
jgi:NitT/TauT family transport system substrate-binding protein